MTPAITSSSAWLRSVVQLFASQGVDPASLFAEVGLDPAKLKLPHERFATEDLNRLWEIAVRTSGQLNLGLDRQLAKKHLKFEIATQPMWSGRTLLDGLEGLSRYLLLIGDSAGFTLRMARGDAWLELLHGTDPRLPRQRFEFGLLGLLMLCEKVTSHKLRPLAVEFVFPEPADFHAYRMAFHCPLRFGQPVNRLRLGREDLALPIVRPTDSVVVLHERVIESRLERFAN
ncbi:MAG TPA: AraC family transcriptional regulator, partial [Ramlibacter sp.]|nr:AraC family transcriptional regulator [Ramlibacter sp.]